MGEGLDRVIVHARVHEVFPDCAARRLLVEKIVAVCLVYVAPSRDDEFRWVNVVDGDRIPCTDLDVAITATIERSGSVIGVGKLDRIRQLLAFDRDRAMFEERVRGAIGFVI